MPQNAVKLYHKSNPELGRSCQLDIKLRGRPSGEEPASTKNYPGSGFEQHSDSIKLPFCGGNGGIWRITQSGMEPISRLWDQARSCQNQRNHQIASAGGKLTFPLR